MMKSVRKPSTESGRSLKLQQSQLASRPFAQKAEEHEAPRGEPRFSFSLADIDIFPRETVQPKLRLGPVGERYEQEADKPLPNRTGMPDRLKAGIESLSGIDMSDVRVHASSPKPAQLNALAYTQGNQIHLGPGQERHLPHEAWHVVQQKQGRVLATMQMKEGIPVNDDKGLEHEADVMGTKALQMTRSDQVVTNSTSLMSKSLLRRKRAASPSPAFDAASIRREARPYEKKVLQGRSVSSESCTIQRISYEDAKAQLEPSYEVILDDWLIYQASAGPESFNMTHEEILGPLNLNQLTGRLSYWLDNSEAHPSGSPKMEKLKSPKAPESEKTWSNIISIAWNLAEKKVDTELKQKNCSPLESLKKIIGQKNIEISQGNMAEVSHDIYASIIKHLLVSSKDVSSYLKGRENRSFPEQLLYTVQQLLNHKVKEIVQRRVQDVVSDYFKKEGDALSRFLIDEKLLNGNLSVIPPEKLTKYVLNTKHPVGGNKAKVFLAVLGLAVENWEVLNNALKNAVATQKPILETGRVNEYGASFTIRFMMNGVGDKSANQGLIESAWIYKRSENFPTLVTCYIVGGGKNWLPNVTYESIFADGTLVRNDEHPQRLPQPTWEYVKLHMGPRIEKRIMQNGRVFQERYYNEKGYPVKDVDYTSPTFPDGRPFADHAEPDHEHLWIMKNSEKPQDGWMRQGGDI